MGVGILAGGMSSRMGRDKALLDFGGVTFLERLVRELSLCGIPVTEAAAFFTMFQQTNRQPSRLPR